MRVSGYVLGRTGQFVLGVLCLSSKQPIWEGYLDGKGSSRSDRLGRCGLPARDTHARTPPIRHGSPRPRTIAAPPPPPPRHSARLPLPPSTHRQTHVPPPLPPRSRPRFQLRPSAAGQPLRPPLHPRYLLLLYSASTRHRNWPLRPTGFAHFPLSYTRRGTNAGIPGLDESYLPRWIGLGFGALVLLNHLLTPSPTPAQLVGSRRTFTPVYSTVMYCTRLFNGLLRHEFAEVGGSGAVPGRVLGGAAVPGEVPRGGMRRIYFSKCKLGPEDECSEMSVD